MQSGDVPALTVWGQVFARKGMPALNSLGSGVCWEVRSCRFALHDLRCFVTPNNLQFGNDGCLKYLKLQNFRFQAKAAYETGAQAIIYARGVVQQLLRPSRIRMLWG